jgi:hypothetical protein
MFTPSRILGLGVAFGLAAGLLVGAGLNQPGRADAAAPSAAPTPAVDSGTADGDSAALAPVTTGGGTVTSAGSAIAYPYVGGLSRCGARSHHRRHGGRAGRPQE